MTYTLLSFELLRKEKNTNELDRYILMIKLATIHILR